MRSPAFPRSSKRSSRERRRRIQAPATSRPARQQFAGSEPFDLRDDRPRFDVEDFRQVKDAGQRRLVLAALEAAEIRRMHVRFPPELEESPSFRATHPPNDRAKTCSIPIQPCSSRHFSPPRFEYTIHGLHASFAVTDTCVHGSLKCVSRTETCVHGCRESANPRILRMHVSLAVALLRIPRFFVFAREKLQSMDCTNVRTFTI